MPKVVRVNTGTQVGFLYFNENTKMHHLKTVDIVYRGIVEDNEFAPEEGEVFTFTKFSSFSLLKPKW